MEQDTASNSLAPSPLNCLGTLLLATDDTYEARTEVFSAFTEIFQIAVYEAPDSRDRSKRLAENTIWKARLRTRVATPSTFFNKIWLEILSVLEDFDAYLEDMEMSEGSFMGLRVQKHTKFLMKMLQSGYNGHFTDFVTKLAKEQPRYIDQPSNLDELNRQQKHDDHFPALEHVLFGVEKNDEIQISFISLLLHQVAYTCSLFTQTEYKPPYELLKEFEEYRIEQLTYLLADPTSALALETRTHYASVNFRGIFDFILLQALRLLKHYDEKILTWLMYRWYINCVKYTFGNNTHDLFAASFYHASGLDEVTNPIASPVEDFTPEGFVQIRVPEAMVQRWLQDDVEALEDVQFEPAGPRTLVKHVAKPVQPLPDSTCAVCLEVFDIRKATMVAWKVVCGHTFHARCLKEMVNGIEPNSNCCPLCRKEICAARQRRAIEYVSDEENAD